MSRESNLIEYEQLTGELKNEYAHIQKTLEELRKNNNKAEIDKMEQQAKVIEAELIKIDPDYLEKRQLTADAEWEDEPESLTANELKKRDYKDRN